MTLDLSLAGLANAIGAVNGQTNNVSGNTQLTIQSSTANGNALMQANGGGVGPSSAMTQAGLMLNDSIAGARSMWSDSIHKLEDNHCCII